MDRKAELLAALTPWIAGALTVATASVLIMVGHDIGATGERAKIANECRQAKAFTSKRTGFLCSKL